MTPEESPPGEPWPAAWAAACGAVGGIALLAITLLQRPPHWPVAPRVSPLEWTKLWMAGRSGLALVVLNLAAVGGSRPLAALCRTDDRRLTLVLRLTLGLFVLAHAVLALGLAHWLTVGALVGVSVVAALAACFPVARVRSWPSAFADAFAGRGVASDPWLIAAALLLPTLSAFVPLYGWDALTYHLALPERFLRLGRLEYSPFSIFTTFPLLTEMLNTLALALDGPRLAKLLCVEIAGLLLLALAAMGRRYGRAGALFAVACLLADPLFMWETTIVYADLAFALLALLAADAVARWDASPDRTAAARAIVLVGCCAGARYQGAVVCLALAAALALGGRQPLRRRLLLGLSLGAGALAFLAPWLLRNVANTGTPLAINAFDPVAQRQLVSFTHGIGMGRSLPALLSAPWHLAFGPTPRLYSGGFGFEVGPLYLLAAALALLSAHDARVGLFLRAALLQFLAWFFTEQEARFLLPMLVLLAAAGSESMARLVRGASPRQRLALGAAPVGLLLLGQLGFWNSIGPLYRMALGDVPWDRIRADTPTELIGEVLRAERRANLKVLPLFESRAWHLRGVDSILYQVNEASPALLAVHRALIGRSLCAWLAGQRITHVVLNAGRDFHPAFVEGYDETDYEYDRRQLQKFLSGSARLSLELRGSSLFELRPAGECYDVGS